MVKDASTVEMHQPQDCKEQGLGVCLFIWSCDDLIVPFSLLMGHATCLTWSPSSCLCSFATYNNKNFPIFVPLVGIIVLLLDEQTQLSLRK